MTQMNRRDLLAGAGALGLASILPMRASAAGSLTAAIYPGTWEEAYRGVVAPALKKSAGVDVAFDSLFAVDQVAKVRAARGVPPFDCFVLDPGPAAAAQAAGSGAGQGGHVADLRALRAAAPAPNSFGRGRR